MNKTSLIHPNIFLFPIMIAALLILFIKGATAAEPVHAKNKTYFVGYAHDIDSQLLLYSEHHQYVTPTLHKVEYKEPDGKLFATKTIDYSHSFVAPDFTQHNERNGEKITVYRQQTRVKGAQYDIQYQEHAQAAPKLDSLAVPPHLVIDAGFDHFIINNWEALLAQKSFTIDYLIPSALDHYELTIKEKNCPHKTAKTHAVNANENSIHCFSISASNFFIGLFSSQLELTYAKNHSQKMIRLIEFQGRSNISDRDGNYQDVNIKYVYF